MVRIRETGLFGKWRETALILAYNMYIDKDFEFDFIIEEDGMVLDEFNIALGSFMFGIVMAIISFSIELILCLQIVLPMIKSYLLKLQV